MDITQTILLIFSILISAAVIFDYGKKTAAIKSLEEKTNLTLLAALWATVESKGLQRSTIIQRIIDKYHPVQVSSPEKLQDMEQALQKLAGFDAEEMLGVKKDLYNFDEELQKDPKELV